MSTFFKSPFIRASVIIVALGFGATGVMAEPMIAKPVQQGASSNLLLIDYKKGHYKKYKRYDKKRHWRYDRRYGKRYHHRRHGYNYYYDGYWYPRPYWRYDNPGIYLHLNL